MPPVILLAFLGVVGLAGYKIINGIAAGAERNQNQKAARAARRQQVRDLGHLEWDESAGVYRPRPKRDA